MVKWLSHFLELQVASGHQALYLYPRLACDISSERHAHMPLDIALSIDPPTRLAHLQLLPHQLPVTELRHLPAPARQSGRAAQLPGGRERHPAIR